MARKTPRKSDGQLVRFKWFHERLKESAYPTPEDIAKQFNVALSTAYKDIEFFKKTFNPPLAYDVNRRGFYYSDPLFSLDELLPKEVSGDGSKKGSSSSVAEKKEEKAKTALQVVPSVSKVTSEQTSSLTQQTPTESELKGVALEQALPARMRGKKISGKEVVSIIIAEQMRKFYQDSPFASAVDSAFHKLLEILDGPVSYDLDSLKRILTVDVPSVATIDLSIFNALRIAIEENETIILKYFSGQRAAITNKSCDPYHITNYKDNWYLIAFCHEKKDYRDFLVNRIISIEFTGSHFVPDKNFSISEHMKSSQLFRGMQNPIKVVIEFDKYAAHWIRIRPVHPTQKITERADGSLEISLEVYSYENILRWVLSFGEHARILSPSELRERVRKTISRMNFLYNRL